ncbi:MAG: MlaD family protein [Gallionellaceae bacterium]|jgi:phospholipid/cholesterol/gamma-HCH transport system substrate-binding protein
METKVNYVLVGLFALLLSVAMIAGVLWLSAGKQYRAEYDTYLAYMNESVSGLNLNAPVKYRGVEVGQINLITLDKENPEQVRLEFAIERGIPIKQDTVAVLKSQGLTGIAYIELSGGSSTSPLLEPKKSAPYPVIKTGPSLMGRLDTALSTLLNNLNTTTENLNALLDEDNRKVLKHTLADVSVLSRTLAAHKADIDKSLTNTSLTMENVAQISVQLPQLIEKIGRTTESIEKMGKEMSRASAGVRTTLDDVGPDVRRFANDGLPELERMMVSMRELMVSLQRLTEQVEQNPGVLLRGKDARQRGPGE